MIEQILFWSLSCISIIGVWLNIKKKSYCFLIWMFTNVSWMCIDFFKGIYAQAFLFLVYFILAIKGFYDWRKNKE